MTQDDRTALVTFTSDLRDALLAGIGNTTPAAYPFTPTTPIPALAPALAAIPPEDQHIAVQANAPAAPPLVVADGAAVLRPTYDAIIQPFSAAIHKWYVIWRGRRVGVFARW